MPDHDPKLLFDLMHALNTVQPALSHPYPDDSRSTPWKRWIQPVYERLGDELDRQALEVPADA